MAKRIRNVNKKNTAASITATVKIDEKKFAEEIKRVLASRDKPQEVQE